MHNALSGSAEEGRARAIIPTMIAKMIRNKHTLNNNAFEPFLIFAPLSKMFYPDNDRI